jgi:hypothetical protein
MELRLMEIELRPLLPVGQQSRREIVPLRIELV